MSLVRRAAAVSAGLLGAGAALYVGVHQGYVPVPGQDPGRDTVVASVDLVGNGAHRRREALALRAVRPGYVNTNAFSGSDAICPPICPQMDPV